MSLSSPKQLMAFLEAEGLMPKKSFSQNFLIDGNIVKNTVTLADLQKGDTVLEIGPGPGALTQKLLEQEVNVIAVELDRGFAKVLGRLQTPDERLQVIQDDILKLDIPQTLAGLSKVKVVANLPYSITSVILGKLLPYHNLFESLTLMVQKEVADRLVSTLGKEYSSLSVFVQTYAEISYGFTVEPTCFYPRPKVRSSVILLKMKKTVPNIPLEPFFVFVRQCFNQRRKMLGTVLKDTYDKDLVRKTLHSLGHNENARAGELTPVDFVNFFSRLSLDASSP